MHLNMQVNLKLFTYLTPRSKLLPFLPRMYTCIHEKLQRKSFEANLTFNSICYATPLFTQCADAISQIVLKCRVNMVTYTFNRALFSVSKLSDIHLYSDGYLLS